MSAEDVFSHLDWQEFLLLDAFQLNLTCEKDSGDLIWELLRLRSVCANELFLFFCLSLALQRHAIRPDCSSSSVACGSPRGGESQVRLRVVPRCSLPFRQRRLTATAQPTFPQSGVYRPTLRSSLRFSAPALDSTRYAYVCSRPAPLPECCGVSTC